MERLSPSARSDRFGSKINRDHSTFLANFIPWASIMLGSMATMLPIIAPAPMLPPLGFILLLAWHLLRPGLLPLWTGLPLGLFDDCLSGQPLGFGILFFTLALLVVELIQIRFPWPNFLHDWLTAAAMITASLLFGVLLSGAVPGDVHVGVMVPQLVLSIVLFPVAAKLVAALDRIRLLRIRRVA